VASLHLELRYSTHRMRWNLVCRVARRVKCNGRRVGTTPEDRIMINADRLMPRRISLPRGLAGYCRRLLPEGLVGSLGIPVRVRADSSATSRAPIPSILGQKRSMDHPAGVRPPPSRTSLQGGAMALQVGPRIRMYRVFGPPPTKVVVRP